MDSRCAKPELRMFEWLASRRMLHTGRNINDRLVMAEGFERWIAGMIESATPVSTSVKRVGRKGEPEAYSAITEETSKLNRAPGQLLSDVEAEQVGWVW
jgi:hypothetical protein